MKEILGIIFILLAFLNLKRAIQDEDEFFVTPLLFDTSLEVDYKLVIYSFFDPIAKRAAVELQISEKLMIFVKAQYRNYYFVQMGACLILGIFFILVQNDYRMIFFMILINTIVFAVSVIFKKKFYEELRKLIP